MPKFCDDGCKKTGPVCDFCRYFNYNGNKKGHYIGNGYCVKLEKRRDPGDGCGHFICTQYMVVELD